MMFDFNEKKLKENIKTNLKKYRKEKNLTQQELAKLLKVSPSTPSSWEQGIATPDMDTLASICQILEINLYDMTGIEPNKIELTLTELEKEIILAYRQASETDKLLTKKVLGIKEGLLEK